MSFHGFLLFFSVLYRQVRDLTGGEVYGATAAREGERRPLHGVEAQRRSHGRHPVEGTPPARPGHEGATGVRSIRHLSGLAPVDTRR